MLKCRQELHRKTVFVLRCFHSTRGETAPASSSTPGRPGRWAHTGALRPRENPSRPHCKPTPLFTAHRTNRAPASEALGARVAHRGQGTHQGTHLGIETHSPAALNAGGAIVAGLSDAPRPATPFRGESHILRRLARTRIRTAPWHCTCTDTCD